MANTVSKFFFILGAHKQSLPILLVYFLISALLEMAGLALLAPFVATLVSPEVVMRQPAGQWAADTFGAATQFRFIALLGALLLTALIMRAATIFWINWKKLDFAESVRSTLVSRLIGNYLLVPWTFHLQRNTVEALQAINGHTQTFVRRMLLPVLQLIVSCLTGLAILIVLFLIKPFATLSVLVLVVIVIAGTDTLIKRRLMEYGRRQMLASQRLARTVKQSIYAGKEIRVLGCEANFLAESETYADEVRITSRYIEAISAVPRLMLEVVIVTFIVGFSLFWLERGGGSDIVVTLSVFGVAAIRLMPLTTQVADALAGLRGAAIPMQRLYEDLRAQPLVFRESQTIMVVALPTDRAEPFRRLDLRGVSYHYPEAHEASLHNITVTLNPCESLGVVGQSGSGKTTLMDIMLGLLIPSGGEILVNGQKLSEQRDYWRRVAAYIPQEVFLADDSIRHNVAFGVPSDQVNDEQVWRALAMARLDDLVRSYPRGIETQTGERGLRLSGGQRQRIALARAFYHDRQVLFLDEATSALDHETEMEIVRTIEDLRSKKTLVLIAHRLSTISRCDRIIRLNHGRVSEEIMGPARLTK
ncbi:MAG: ABC transporter ATP-binding protein [Nevskiales bacterium]